MYFSSREVKTYYSESRTVFLLFACGCAWQCLNKRDIDGLPTQAVHFLLQSSFFWLCKFSFAFFGNLTATLLSNDFDPFCTIPWGSFVHFLGNNMFMDMLFSKKWTNDPHGIVQKGSKLRASFPKMHEINKLIQL